jgi:hypothetical protein
MLRSAKGAIRRHPLVRGAKSILRSPLALRAGLRDRFYRERVEHPLAICAIFRDEADFLDEWIRFHAGVGVTQFYLYDNGSGDHFRDVLEPYIARGLVTLEPWPRRPGQRSAYRDCLRRRWRAARWIAFIDLDEFLFSPRQVDIRPILQSYSDVRALFVHHVNFGSGGHQTRPAGAMLEAYMHCEPLGQSESGKSIVNPRWVRNVSQSHLFPLWRGDTRNPDGVIISDVAMPPGIGRGSETLRLNHYWSRSIQDIADKIRRGDAFYGVPRDLEEHLQIERGLNGAVDTSIIPIWRAIAG